MSSKRSMSAGQAVASPRWAAPTSAAQRSRSSTSVITREEPAPAGPVTARRCASNACHASEGNKRAAAVLARWLANNDRDGATLVRADDREVTHFLVHAAAGTDIRSELVALPCHDTAHKRAEPEPGRRRLRRRAVEVDRGHGTAIRTYVWA